MVLLFSKDNMLCVSGLTCTNLCCDVVFVCVGGDAGHLVDKSIVGLIGRK
jgi:hypothetical protein